MSLYTKRNVLIVVCALAALLLVFPPRETGEFALITQQGFEYGRGTTGPIDALRLFMLLALVGGLGWVFYWKAPEGRS